MIIIIGFHLGNNIEFLFGSFLPSYNESQFNYDQYGCRTL